MVGDDSEDLVAELNLHRSLLHQTTLELLEARSVAASAAALAAASASGLPYFPLERPPPLPAPRVGCRRRALLLLWPSLRVASAAAAASFFGSLLVGSPPQLPAALVPARAALSRCATQDGFLSSICRAALFPGLFARCAAVGLLLWSARRAWVRSGAAAAAAGLLCALLAACAPAAPLRDLTLRELIAAAVGLLVGPLLSNCRCVWRGSDGSGTAPADEGALLASLAGAAWAPSSRAAALARSALATALAALTVCAASASTALVAQQLSRGEGNGGARPGAAAGALAAGWLAAGVARAVSPAWELSRLASARARFLALLAVARLPPGAPPRAASDAARSTTAALEALRALELRAAARLRLGVGALLASALAAAGALPGVPGAPAVWGAAARAVLGGRAAPPPVGSAPTWRDVDALLLAAFLPQMAAALLGAGEQ
jgi:hypothetical protein